MTTECAASYNGRHSWVLDPNNNDGDHFVCRYRDDGPGCDATSVDTSSGHVRTPSDDWKIRTAGRNFAEDLNSDGTLKTEDN